jgi:hypothetical protein
MKTNNCNKCNVIKNFDTNLYCSSCRKLVNLEIAKKWRENNKEKIKANQIEINKKIKIQRKEFNQIFKEEDLEIKKTQFRKYRAEGKEYLGARKRMLKQKYNLSIEEFDKMFETQNFKCAICSNTHSYGRRNTLHVDHCHETGKVRGLLCNNCNAGMGLLQDNIENLKKAIEYLEKSKITL